MKKWIIRIILILLALLAAVLAYLLLAPVPINPVAWQATPFTGYSPPHARNEKLAALKTIAIGDETGPEHIAMGPDGHLYAAVTSGAILRMQPDGSQREVWVNTGGRVLGFMFDAAGNMIAADAFRGLLSIAPDRQITVLADKVGDSPILYADAVVVAKSGKMYFTDASQRFGARESGGTFHASVLDILEHSSTGRVLEYDPASKQTRVVAEGMCFANGLVLSEDEQQLIVAETGEYRIWKISIQASQLNLKRKPDKKLASILLRDLPGYPDNLMRGRDGRIWLGLAKPRGAAIDSMAEKPWLRSITLRLPRALWPVPPAYGHVLAFNEGGKILVDLQDPSGQYPETTGVTETADRLYIQSLHAHGIGWLPNHLVRK
ncbi:SMP-30/gluconolactonase/LRE family protein [Undibacterium sp. CY18W]|uniref:SMP-30/gluconolactonase/LRE family protein n=1 Tax=Undibacterium hunanense TaxID=2762292 RepID=A0ABR6ZWJ3_9BURK|nr:SMP-30/gluconolactonase/LRE family protein [Undibacterium hunanense]MBC3920239.1 SMP-30/gluconolactonase/LRE family protein [Undibacterium hunanense]